jgi:hypothetical protein
MGVFLSTPVFRPLWVGARVVISDERTLTLFPLCSQLRD